MQGTFYGKAIVTLLLAGWALGVHLAFLAAIPDPWIRPDSATYAAPAIHSLYGGTFDIPLERGPGYPLFLYGILRITHSFFGVLIAQHVLALLTGLGAAWVYYAFIRRSILGSAAIFFLSSSLPVAAVYSHAILAETLFTFFLVAAVLLFLLADRTQAARFWSLAGIVAACAFVTRPAGLGVLTAIMVGSILFRMRGKHPRGWIWTGASAAVVLLGMSAWNYRYRGFFGIDQLSGPALYCSTARYVDPSRIDDPQLRSLLEPIYKRDSAQMSNGEWVYSSPAGPVQQLSALYPTPVLHKVLARLGVQAVAAHPFRCFWDRCKILADFCWSYSAIPPIFVNREFSFLIYRGLTLYARTIRSLPQAWQLVRLRPQELSAYLARLRPLARGLMSQPESYLAEMDRHDVYRYEKVLIWWSPLRGLFRYAHWLSLLAVFSAAFLWFWTGKKRTIGLLILVISLHAAISTMAPFQDPRYSAPLVPIYWILLVGAISQGDQFDGRFDVGCVRK